MPPSPPHRRPHVVLLESVHDVARNHLRDHGARVTARDDSPGVRDLRALLDGAQAVGVRSRTSIGRAEIRAASGLLAIGCFSVGTNNVDLEAAAHAGIPVFNAPHASTRSVAELTVGLVIALARGIVEKAEAARAGRWAKDARGTHEVRGRTLGIVGYGHVGSQVSVLAEALGMRVAFHDIVDKQPLGNAQSMPSLDALLERSDVLTLHVPGGPGTHHLIGARQLARLPKGAALINTARGSVVDEPALQAALRSRRLAGAALDVLAAEPASPKAPLRSALRRLPNVIVTPHVGGSTEEAQRRIAEIVARRLARYLEDGSTRGAVNVPQVDLAREPGTHRLAHVHRNVPGVLSAINAVFSRLGVNVAAQTLRTQGDLGYLLVDVEQEVSRDALVALRDLPETLRARLLS